MLKRILATLPLCSLAGCGLFLDQLTPRNDAARVPDAATRDAGMDANLWDASVASDTSAPPDSFRPDAFVHPDAFMLPDSPDAFSRPEFCNGIDDDGDGLIDEGVCSVGGVDCVPTQFGGNTYARCDANLSWDDARVACISLGFNLVIIETAEENLFVRDQASMLDWRRAGREFWTAPRLWMGLRNQATILDPTEEWRWGDGGTLIVSFWRGGEPNGGLLETCAEMRGWGAEPFEYAWNDSLCGGTRAYLCERNGL